MVDDTIAEEWRPVEGHPGYEVSNLGRVRSVDRWVEEHTAYRRDGIKRRWFRQGRILNPYKSKPGYLVIGRGRDHPIRVHVLVCTAFNGPRPSPKHQVAHGNGDPADNRPENLRWATHAENKADMQIHGTQRRGENSWNARVTEDQVREIRRLRSTGLSSQAIADLFHVSRGLVLGICRGDNWRHVV